MKSKISFRLSRYGALLQTKRDLTLHKFSADNNLLRLHQVSLQDKPTHVGTGGIFLPGDHQQHDAFGVNWVFTPVEGAIPEEIEMLGNDVRPGIVVRHFDETTSAEDGYNGEIVMDTFTTTEGRMFNVTSLKPYERPLWPMELTTDFEAREATRSLHANLKELAHTYPDVDLSK